MPSAPRAFQEYENRFRGTKKWPRLRSRYEITVAVPLFAEGLSVYPWHRTPFCPKISIFSIMRLLQSQHHNIIKKAHSAILSREFCRCWYLLQFRRRFYPSETWLHRWKFRKKSSSFSTRYVWSSAISQDMMITSFLDGLISWFVHGSQIWNVPQATRSGWF